MAVFLAFTQFHAFILIQEQGTLNWQLGKEGAVYSPRQERRCAQSVTAVMHCCLAVPQSSHNH